ncbi:hypothetical protein FISHEDRAFT_70407 [Fistulina hepatica ATCC 64428]|uniref:GATA-type domain-containing protein n=1 Tax=Fistulina hepatica ATCC 64428 TaxID=1128425 RepID=A0A0D7AMA2_9AGAR|nr:hypothetical protein FISHEDRAFT_70407 [Fistulina hepatica ATCC 64428]
MVYGALDHSLLTQVDYDPFNLSFQCGIPGHDLLGDANFQPVLPNFFELTGCEASAAPSAASPPSLVDDLTSSSESDSDLSLYEESSVDKDGAAPANCSKCGVPTPMRWFRNPKTDMVLCTNCFARRLYGSGRKRIECLSCGITATGPRTWYHNPETHATLCAECFNTKCGKPSYPPPLLPALQGVAPQFPLTVVEMPLGPGFSQFMYPPSTKPSPSRFDPSQQKTCASCGTCASSKWRIHPEDRRRLLCINCCRAGSKSIADFPQRPCMRQALLGPASHNSLPAIMPPPPAPDIVMSEAEERPAYSRRRKSPPQKQARHRKLERAKSLHPHREEQRTCGQCGSVHTSNWHNDKTSGKSLCHACYQRKRRHKKFETPGDDLLRTRRLAASSKAADIPYAPSISVSIPPGFNFDTGVPSAVSFADGVPPRLSLPAGVPSELSFAIGVPYAPPSQDTQNLFPSSFVDIAGPSFKNPYGQSLDASCLSDEQTQFLQNLFNPQLL